MTRRTDTLGNLTRLFDSIQRSASMIQQSTKMIEVFASAQQQVEFIRRFTKDNEHLAQVYLAIVPHLADRGWYLAGSLYPDRYLEIRKAIQEGREDEIENFLQNHVRSRLEETLNDACAIWPNRAVILHDAFEAHRQGKYTLSVPALLAQADGICQEILGVNLFYKAKGTPKEQLPKKLMEPKEIELCGERIIVGALANAFVDLLRQSSSVGKTTKDRDEKRRQDPKYGPLNRHGVLHGIDLDYAEEANSLRAIALIAYLKEVKEILDRRSKQ